MFKNKKNIILLAIIVIILVTVAVFLSTNKKEKSQNQSTNTLTAEQVILILKENNINVGRYVVYNEETDLNNLLGRPNQYTSKATFEDTRLEQSNKDLDPEYFSEAEINEPIGGTVEVFSNKEDMQKRKDYVASVTSSMSALVEYSYSNDYILLRLNKDLTPSQAKEYEDIFKSIFQYNNP